MTAPRIILTADDFGRSLAVNAAIARWARAGVLTQASLMVNEMAVDDAVRIARELPPLQVGLHLTLCDGLDRHGCALPASPGWAGVKYAFWPGARSAMRAEIAAQFERFVALGFPPTYWDGHTHLHLHPAVMSAALPVARRMGFTSVRLVREPGPWALLPWIFGRLSARAIPMLRESGIGYADRVFGLRRTGKMRPEDFANAIAAARDGVTEIYFHPGAENELPDPEWVAEKLRSTRS